MMKTINFQYKLGERISGILFETGTVVWYSQDFKNFPQFVIHTVKGFGVVNKAELDVFLELSCFLYDPVTDEI